MKFTKRIILVMLFFISALTFTSFVKHTEVNAEGEVCEIVETGVKYATFADAWTAATSGQTIKLLADTNTGRTFNLTKNITFDFDDYTLTHDGNGPFMSTDIGNTYTLTLKASGSGGLSTTKNLININQNFESSTRINILSGTYNKFNIYCYNGSAGNLQDANFFAKSGLDGILNISGGEFYMGSADARTNLLSFLPDESLKSSTTLPSGSYRYVLEVKPETYITDENTQTSLNLSYEKGYSYYQKVTSLSSLDAGKKYLIGYSNLSEKSILLLTGEKYPAWSYIMTERHIYIANNPSDTWRVESDSKFYGDVNSSYFYTLGYSAGKYTFQNSAGDFLTHTTGTSLTIKTTSEIELAGSYNYEFTFTPSSSYLSTGTGGSTSYITYYTNQRDSKYVFEMYGSAQYSGLGESNKHLYAHLYEKVDIDPVVDEAAIRFGKCITKDTYDFLNNCGTSVSFGVIAKRTSALGGAELTVANASMTREITPVRVSAPGAAVEDLEGDYYQFALVIDEITEADFETSITARVYVCVDGEYYYMSARDFSVKTLAGAYYNALDTSAYTEHLGVLEYLKDYVG